MLMWMKGLYGIQLIISDDIPEGPVQLWWN